MSGGAYRLRLHARRAVHIEAGALGRWRLPPGVYLYVGSARRGLEARVARHRRLALAGEGQRRWHVDALLLHPWVRWLEPELFPGAEECALLAATLRLPGAEVPVPGFGASDCRGRCPAHLVRLPPPATVRL